jgi:glycine/D-amino acid oxidase-like deaminating enzyme
VTGRNSAPDVAVVGGGLVGAATAAFLATAGARVTLYERSGIAAAASGRNSGVIQHPFDPVLVVLYRESLTLYRDLAADGSLGFRIGVEPAGLLMIGDAGAEAVATGVAAGWTTAYPDARAEVVSGHTLAELEPDLAPGLAACRLAIGYPVAPGAATRAYARLAEARRATVRVGAEFGLATRGDVIVGVDVGGRVEPAGAVVVAAGPWTPDLVDPDGAWRPIVARWGVVVQLDLARPPRHVLEEIELDIEPTSSGSSGADDVGVGFSLVTAEGVSALGSTFLDVEPRPESYLAALRERGTRYVPGIASAHVSGLRACARPVAVDGRPLVGAMPGFKGLFVAAGNGPWGISTGPATGRMIADLVLGRDAGIPDALDPARFGPVTAAQRVQRDPLRG